MNLWPYAAVSAMVIVFCSFLVWISPSSKETVIAIAAIVIGWWFKSPGEIVQNAVMPPIERVTVQKEQTNA